MDGNKLLKLIFNSLNEDGTSYPLQNGGTGHIAIIVNKDDTIILVAGYKSNEQGELYGANAIWKNGKLLNDTFINDLIPAKNSEYNIEADINPKKININVVRYDNCSAWFSVNGVVYFIRVDERDIEFEPLDTVCNGLIYLMKALKEGKI